jgi:hypothetical protein
VAALAHNDIQQIAGAIGGTQSARLIERSQASVRVVGSVRQGPLPGLVSSVPFVARQASGDVVRVLGMNRPGAAQLVVTWSHRDRVRSEACFARLAGVAPLPASSGQTIPHRLSRGGDRQLNALCTP